MYCQTRFPKHITRSTYIGIPRQSCGLRVDVYPSAVPLPLTTSCDSPLAKSRETCWREPVEPRWSPTPHSAAPEFPPFPAMCVHNLGHYSAISYKEMPSLVHHECNYRNYQRGC